MEITTTVTVPDYVYHFYQKIAQKLGSKTESVLSEALLTYAGFLSHELIREKETNSPSDSVC